MDFADHLKTFKFDYSSSHPDIEYLTSSNVTHTVSRGLSELYKIQPKNPVTFLANWLVNESRSKEILKQFEENKKVKQEVKQQHDMIIIKRQEEQKLIQAELDRKNKEKENFFEKIKNCRDFEDNLNGLCEELKNFVRATGVYVSIYDKKRKARVGEEDDENSHLLEEKALRYISYCQDHQFMKNKYLEPGNGITYKLIFPSEENTNAENNENIPGNIELENQNNNQDNLIGNIIANSGENDTKHSDINESLPEVYEKEVVMRPEMKFFREPRLGCYLAVDMTYNSSLSLDSLISAINNYEEYKTNLSAQEERKKQHEQRIIDLQKEKMDLSSTGNNNIDDPEKINENEMIDSFNEEPVVLQVFHKNEKKLVISLDTLGQDREFTEEEKRLIYRTVRAIKTTWEKLEESLLLKDRDLKIELDEINRHLNEQYTYDKILLEEEKFIKEYLESDEFKEDPIKDEKLKLLHSDMARSKFILKSFFEDENIETIFLKYAEFEFVRFDTLFQNVLYFINIDNLSINEENTNRLEWKKAKQFWNLKILEMLRDYSPLGAKPEKIKCPYSYGNRILYNLEMLNSRREEIRNESFVLDRLLEFLLLILKIRRDDILIRRDEITELMDKRNTAIQNHNERLERRSRDLEEARNSFTSEKNPEDVEEDENKENVVEFDEEEFLRKWDEENPEIEIPEEVFYDEDCDFELEKLGL